MSVESTQVKLRLTQNKEVLKQLKKNRAIYTDKDGQITYCCQYDSQCLYFKPGVGITFPKTIADNLQKSNKVIVGDHLGGDFNNILVAIAEWPMGMPEPDGKNKTTTCPICGADQYYIQKLAKHIAKHAEENKKNYSPDYKPKGKVDWDIQLPAPESKPTPIPRPEVTDDAIDSLPDEPDPTAVDDAQIEELEAGESVEEANEL